MICLAHTGAHDKSLGTYTHTYVYIIALGLWNDSYAPCPLSINYLYQIYPTADWMRVTVFCF